MAPHQSCRERDADALASIGRRNHEHVLIAIMAENVPIPSAKNDAVAACQVETADVARVCPARRAVCVQMLGFAGPPQGEGESCRDGHAHAAKEDQRAGLEDVAGVDVEVIPPEQELPGCIERVAKQNGVRGAELRLIAKCFRSPLRRNDRTRDEGEENARYLPPVNVSGAHQCASPVDRRRTGFATPRIWSVLIGPK